MKLSIAKILKEIEKWSEIYDFHVLTAHKFKSITITKSSTELFSVDAETTSECFALALEYVERVNPLHKLNRTYKENIKPFDFEVDVENITEVFEPINVSDEVMQKIISGVLQPKYERGVSLRTMCAPFSINMSRKQFNSYRESWVYHTTNLGVSQPYTEFTSPNTLNAIRLVITTTFTVGIDEEPFSDFIDIEIQNYHIHSSQNCWYMIDDKVSFN